jgi:predicted adenylyl cyclase CyaB
MVWLEVETKIKLKDSEVPEFRKNIKKIGIFEKKCEKIDNYFAIQRKSKKYPKKAFRIRSLGDKYQINFKRPLKKFWTKEIVVKHEFEFYLKGKSERDSLIELFQDLGFTKWIEKIKFNETYLWKKDKRVSIEINKVKNLGYFIEIEYLVQENEIEKAKSSIKKVLKELNIRPEQINNKGYTKMLWEMGKSKI